MYINIICNRIDSRFASEPEPLLNLRAWRGLVLRKTNRRKCYPRWPEAT